MKCRVSHATALSLLGFGLLHYCEQRNCGKAVFAIAPVDWCKSILVVDTTATYADAGAFVDRLDSISDFSTLLLQFSDQDLVN